jgi:hypothetical protein
MLLSSLLPTLTAVLSVGVSVLGALLAAALGIYNAQGYIFKSFYVCDESSA